MRWCRYFTLLHGKGFTIHAMQTSKEADSYLNLLLTSGPDVVGWLTSRPGSFTLGKELRLPLIFFVIVSVRED